MDKNKYKISVDSGIFMVYVDSFKQYRITTNLNEVPNGFVTEHKSYEEAKKDVDRRLNKKTS
jgi:hypothetical protein